MFDTVIPILQYIYLAIICLMTAQAIFSIRLRLYIWEEPERAILNSAPAIYRAPQLSFTILLPAYHEEALYAETIQKVYDLNYPKQLVQILALLREHDTGTIKVAQEKLKQLHAPNVQLLITNDKHGGKPHQLNLGLKVARGDIVTIFDAEDEPHPDILQVINTIFLDESIDAVQSGVQLMNHNTKWFCFLNVLEYFFWFKSSLHFFARCGMTPLGGNTVFVRRRLMEHLGGWDHTTLTEDADLGIRLCIARANVRILYDDEFVTKEETPHSIKQFIKQRTRWNQGFIQILFRGRWLRLEKPSQKLLAFYVLVLPELMAFFTLMIPVSIAMLFFVKLPLWIAILTFMPLYCFILAMCIDLAGLHEFVKVHHRKWKWREALTLLIAFIPYQWLLGIGALRAVWRQVRGASNWEKTAHIGQHKANSPRPQPLAPLPSPQPWRPPQSEEQDAASMTLVRAPNFFVRAFAPRSQADSLTITGARGSLLDRIRWTSTDRQWLFEAQPRLLPQADISQASHTAQREIPLPGWLEGLVVVLILGALLAFQALNIFHAPYTSDEGTLMANAQAILQGKITPYTYDYSQPPLGWIQIAGWVKLTGGIASFGNAINSGRVLMLILAGASSLLLYLITSHLSGSRSAALLAMVLYTLSPLSLLYRDQVLLYNIGTFWLLLSLWLVTSSKSRLGMFALAAAALGIAILSDELFLIFLPTMLYAVSLYATSFQRNFSKVAFAYVTLAISSVAVLLALLKSEILPSGDPLAHPSLIGAFGQVLKSEFLPSGNPIAQPGVIVAFLLKAQSPLADQQSSAIWQRWLQMDLLLLAAGTAAMLLNILGGIVNRFQLLAALLGVTVWIVLIVNNVWYPYSIVPLLPFLALNIALALNAPLRWLTRHIGFDLTRVFLFFVLVGMLVPAEIQYAQPLLAPNGSQPQQQAMTWVRDNVPRNAVIIIDSYMYVDLLDPQGMAVGGGTPFTKAQIYTNAALDPAIAEGQLHEQWQNIDFLVVDPGMLKDIRTDRRFILLNEALHHAALRVSFGSSQDGTLIQIYQVIRL
jgi:cellulose synthase/poly-beta-1,6-N-acetylglucosamine synthase-like glycosyltransferase/4-amino-4-deoxy-L-arabinose transferase-like glycosyltransferase